ncbi:MAG: sigma-70 family RNA polymerase sigma factor [Bacilli bacterium]|nr:sigma-70 family RNA polymerase sigma factor [Bacilli bacterium]
MYKQLKKQLDEKRIIDRMIKELTDRIEFIIHKKLGLKGSSYSDIKIEMIGVTEDKYLQAFAKVENLDKDRELLIEEKNIIVDFIDDVYKSINNMNNQELNVFKCRYMLGLSNRQTAERLGYGIDRIKQINREITKKL